jgi:predicted HNH restriction endonuclease
MKKRYPWVENLLEIHHLLPLASVVKMDVIGTEFSDVVPLCPNCHRSVHMYYKDWLKTHHLDDFEDKAQANSVYTEIKSAIIKE